MIVLVFYPQRYQKSRPDSKGNDHCSPGLAQCMPDKIHVHSRWFGRAFAELADTQGTHFEEPLAASPQSHIHIHLPDLSFCTTVSTTEIRKWMTFDVLESCDWGHCHRLLVIITRLVLLLCQFISVVRHVHVWLFSMYYWCCVLSEVVFSVFDHVTM